MSEASTPVFQIQRVYMKEASLEQPNSPGILLEQQQPAVDIQLGVEAIKLQRVSTKFVSLPRFTPK